MSKHRGYRGYIGSRPYNGSRVPQHVQNLVIRDYCHRHSLTYLLSVTEYAMPGCYMMLEEVANEAPRLEGIVLYSLFMLPQRRTCRLDFCQRLLRAGTTVHGAVENLAIVDDCDVYYVDEIIMLQSMVQSSELRIEF